MKTHKILGGRFWWIWIVLWNTSLKDGTDSALIFQLTTIPGFLILQELDERIGEFLKSGGNIALDRSNFTYTDIEKKKMYTSIEIVRNSCIVALIIGFIVLGFIINGPDPNELQYDPSKAEKYPSRPMIDTVYFVLRGVFDFFNK